MPFRERCFTMKQYIAFVVTGIVLLLSVLVSANYELKSDNIEATQKIASVSEVVYVLKQSNGHLAVYKAGENEPFVVTETLLSTLPYEDQKKLSDGIVIRGDKNLRIALEDYCS